jgi:hypothetical protein
LGGGWLGGWGGAFGGVFWGEGRLHAATEGVGVGVGGVERGLAAVAGAALKGWVARGPARARGFPA